MNTAPFIAGSPTSESAAQSMTPHLSELHKTILGFMALYPTNGLTDEEMQFALELNPSTQRPRRIELLRKGLIADSGLTRPTKSGRQAVVWRLARREEQGELL